MKVFVSVDIEGVAGVNDALQGRPGNVEYEYARRLMTEEASAAVRGAINGSASTVVVADSHALMINILPDMLDPRARLIAGSPRMFSMIHGLDATFDALIFVGFHAAAGTRGVMSHTLNGLAFSRVEIDGRLIGEVELFGGYAAEIGIPLLVVTGDNLLAEETKVIFPNATPVIVKKHIGGWASESVSPEEARTKIEGTVSSILSTHVSSPVTLLRAAPFAVEVEMTRQFFADACSLLPEVTRLSSTRISFEAKCYGQAVRILQAFSWIVTGVQK